MQQRAWGQRFRAASAALVAMAGLGVVAAPPAGAAGFDCRSAMGRPCVDFQRQEGTWTAPAGVTSVDITLVGADGRDGSGSVEGGDGAVFTVRVSVMPGEALH